VKPCSPCTTATFFRASVELPQGITTNHHQGQGGLPIVGEPDSGGERPFAPSSSTPSQTKRGHPSDGKSGRTKVLGRADLAIREGASQGDGDANRKWGLAKHGAQRPPLGAT